MNFTQTPFMSDYIIHVLIFVKILSEKDVCIKAE